MSATRNADDDPAMPKPTIRLLVEILVLGYGLGSFIIYLLLFFTGDFLSLQSLFSSPPSEWVAYSIGLTTFISSLLARSGCVAFLAGTRLIRNKPRPGAPLIIGAVIPIVGELALLATPFVSEPIYVRATSGIPPMPNILYALLSLLLSLLSLLLSLLWLLLSRPEVLFAFINAILGIVVIKVDRSSRRVRVAVSPPTSQLS